MILILGVSILLQLVAAVQALRLIRVSGGRLAWSLVALAACLMTVRRAITLYQLVRGVNSKPPDPVTELVALAISILMVAGITLIAPLFRALQRSELAIRQFSQSTEMALRESEERLRVIVDQAHNAFVAMGADGIITDWNRQAEITFGWLRTEVVGQPMADLIIPPRHRERHLQGLRHYLSTGEGAMLGRRFEISALNRHGREFPIEISITPIKLGERRFFAAFLHDITERQAGEAQLRKQREELAAANHELEAFSYSVSHDLRAPLRAINGFSRMLQEDHAGKLDDEGQRLLKVIHDNTRVMGTLIDDLLAFSRLARKPLELHPVAMGELARAAARELATIEPARQVVVEIELMPSARGDAGLLRQVFANLIGNAWKFTRGRQDPRILVGGWTAGAENHYYVKDNGVGFDMRYADKLFGVFQRLHAQSEFEGTGVGLAIVQRIVARHGGSVRAEGTVGAGAAFYFTLPAGEES